MCGKKLFRFFSLVFAFFSFPIFVSAQETVVLTVDDAVGYAMERNVTIQQRGLEFEQLELNKKNSWNSMIPSASVGANFSVPYRNENVDFMFNWSASLSLALTPAIYSAMKGATLAYENGELTYEQTLRTIELSVRQTFYQLIYFQESIKMLERSMDTAKMQYEQALRQYNLGQRSELDMLQTRVNYEAYMPTIEDARISYLNGLASFKQIIGVPQDVDIELSGSLDEINELGEIYLDYDVDNTPKVKIAQKGVEIATNNLLSSRFGAYGPRVTMGFTYGHSYSQMSKKAKDASKAATDAANAVSAAQDAAIAASPVLAPFKSSFGSSGGSSSEWSDTNSALTLGVSIPLDGYLPWSSGARSISQAKSGIKNAELTLQDTKTTVEVQVANYLAQIRQIKSQLSTLKGTIDLSQRSYEMARQAYNQGARDLLTLQATSDALLQANVNLAAQQYSLIVAVLSLENTLGVPFGTLGK